MSSSGFSITPDLHDVMECPICCLRFERPLQLSCGHSFCSSCVDRLVADARAGGNRNDNFLNMIPPEPVPIRANVNRGMDQPNVNRMGGEIWMHIAHMAHPPIPGLGGFAHPQYLVRNIVPHDEQPFIHRRMNLMGGGDHIIKCPECRQPTRVPPEGLPVNFRLQEVLDRMADSSAAANSLDSRDAASNEADTDGHPRCLVCNDVMHKGIYLVCLTCVGENVSTQTVMEAFGRVADGMQFELLSRTEQLDSKVRMVQELCNKLQQLPGVIKNVTDEFHNRIVTVMDEFIRNALGQDDIRRDSNLGNSLNGSDPDASMESSPVNHQSKQMESWNISRNWPTHENKSRHLRTMQRPDILRKRPYVTRARAKQEGYNANHSDLEADRQRREMENRGNEDVEFIAETPAALRENIGDESIEILSEASSAADENKKNENVEFISEMPNMQRRGRGSGATVERSTGNKAVENGGYPPVAESSSHRERVMKRKYGAIITVDAGLDIIQYRRPFSDPGPSSFSATHGNGNMDYESADHIPNDTGESGSD
ncbi:unnamed protein product [Angiostrongylus costaricensis]|uniref:RING-type domain-containing protein n=1 Tax=Angiostrongylus costaricensis TaxID=334426 RepID=A0A158PLA7_ANGCS|nr:unnamed protein product [Angiostrongylus costaricensis]